MKWLGLSLLLLLVLGLAAGAWVRLAPVDPARWHKVDDAGGSGDYPGANSFQAVRIVTSDPLLLLTGADRIILETPRTRRIAGNPEGGMTTYETRSRLWGFPDYTTVWIEQAGGAPLLHIHGRAHYGKSDMGVNQARIGGWLGQLGFSPR